MDGHVKFYTDKSILFKMRHLKSSIWRVRFGESEQYEILFGLKFVDMDDCPVILSAWKGKGGVIFASQICFSFIYLFIH